MILCVALLVLIRAFESELFYDPLLAYFHGNFTALPIPSVDLGKLIGSAAFRFLLNSAASLLLLWSLFPQKGLFRLASMIYAVIFILLIIAFWMLMAFSPDSKLAIFYVRRFLIQPILLLVLIPAFYFQVRSGSKS